MSLRWIWYFLTFCVGMIVASALFLTYQPFSSPTGYALAGSPIPELQENNTTESVQLPIISDFQNNETTTLSGKCERNPYTALWRNYSYICNIFYNSSVSVRQVGTTGSMWPALQGGGFVIFVNVTNASELVPGDIIIINESVYGQEVVHRIIEVANDTDGMYFVTKGDNNSVPDNIHIRANEIIGRVVGVLY